MADRLLPALLFAGAAGARAAQLVGEVEREGVAQPARLVAGALAVAFCGLVAVLLLERRPRAGGRAGALPLALALGGTLLMNGAAAGAGAAPEPALAAVGDGLLAAGLAVCIYAAASLGSSFGVAPEARGLVTTGAYRHVRHPLYLGELVAGLGIALASQAAWAWLVFAAFCACQLGRAVLEERALAAAFPEYAAYRGRTPALVPRLRGR